MMRSMYSGVSGLRIHQTKMDVIANNISNVNTIGFKASRVTFSEVFSQTVQGASGPNENRGGTNPMQIGLGAGISSIDVNMEEGAPQRTDRPLDLKIEGEGFFVVSDVTGDKFTRAGNFSIDQAGNLVTQSGMKVMGWQVDPTTKSINKTTASPLKILGLDNLYSEPSMTTKATMAGNVNKNDDKLPPAEGGIDVSMKIYDSLGYSYNVNLKLQETAPGVYDVILPANSITDEKGNTINNDAIGAGTVTMTFDPDTGKITNAPATFTIDNINTTFSNFPANLEVDFSSVTMFSGKTTLEAVAGDKDGLDSGNAAGSIQGFEVSGNGEIRGRYSNGKTKLLGQVIVASFKNPAGLQKLGDNLFAATNNSGTYDGIGVDISSLGGSFKSGVLEMANVELAREFSDMITTQRGFQANSRIITSSDEMLQELVNLKR